MADYTLPELLQSAGSTTGDFLTDLANKTADAYCSLYKNYPGYIVGYVSNPVGDFRRGLMDSLCRGRPPGLPPPPSSPFTGGQCDCVAYDVSVALYINGNVIFRNVVDCWGPIYGLVLTVVSGNLIAQIDCKGRRSSGSCGARQLVNVTSYSPGQDVRIEYVQRADGQADSCGDPPSVYPTVTPPGSALTPTISVPLPSGGNSLTIPVAFVPVTAEVTVPVTLNNTFNLTFSLGGVTLKTGGGDSFTSADRQTLQQTLNSSNSASTYSQQAASNSNGAIVAANSAASAANDAKNAADAAKNAALDAKKNTNPPKKPSDPGVVSARRPNSERMRSNVPNLLAVKVVLSRLPYKSKQQYGDGAKDVLYCGWFEWLVDGVAEPRVQLSFDQTILYAPKYANGYGFTLTNGAEGYAVEYTDNNT